MANMLKNIPELLQQIRQVENEHNQLVDEYFQMKDHLKQALTNLNNDPSAIHLNIYNSYLILSESMMKNIRTKRFDLTKLIYELNQHGIFDDDDDEDDVESSLDEGIDEHSLSVLDVSSKLSSLNNSDNHPEELFE